MPVRVGSEKGGGGTEESEMKVISLDECTCGLQRDGNRVGSWVLPFPCCMNHGLNGNWNRKPEWPGNKQSCCRVTGADEQRRMFWDVPMKVNTMILEEVSGFSASGRSSNPPKYFSLSQTDS